MSTQFLQFKVASADWEFEQIHQLNYKTFVEEIPQHQPSNSPRLVDKFHSDDRGARATGILPVRINFPQFGSSLYLVSQLTSENQAPSAEFSYQQDKKAGGK